MNSRNHVDKSAVEAGKRAAFILVAIEASGSVSQTATHPASINFSRYIIIYQAMRDAPNFERCRDW
jgi:hypothetical protein